MHSHCFGQYTRYNYTCPVCSKTMGDMSMYFRMIDSLVARSDDLPPGYATRKQVNHLSIHLSSHSLLVCSLITCLFTCLIHSCNSV